MSEIFNTEALQALDDKSELKEMPRAASPALCYYHLRQLTLYDFIKHQPIHH